MDANNLLQRHLIGWSKSWIDKNWNRRPNLDN